jgi:LysR family transcriptional regulator, regulator for metE and metH
VDSQTSRWPLALALVLPSCGKSTNMTADTPTGSATAGAVPKVALGHGLVPAAFVPGRYATAIQRTMHGTHELQVLSEDSTSAFALELAADGTATACRGWRYLLRNDGPEVHTQDRYREQQGYRGRYTLVDGMAEVVRDLHRANGRPRERLRIVVESFSSYPFLPKLVATLAREHPHVEIRIVLEATREPLALLRGVVDLALVSSPVRDAGLVAVPLCDDEWTVIVDPDHPLAKRAYVSAAQLGEETLFSTDAPRSDVERLRERIAAERAKMPHVVKVPLTDVLISLVAAGQGVGLVPRWVVAAQVARGEVVSKRFTRTRIPETWFGVYRRDAAARLPLARVTELLVGMGVASGTR